MEADQFFMIQSLFLAAAPAEQPPIWVSMGPLIILFVVFYFVLIRPQQKKAKEHAALVQAIRSGDKVTTNGGLVGVVVSVKEKTVSIRSSDSKLEILKSAVASITEKAPDSNQS